LDALDEAHKERNYKMADLALECFKLHNDLMLARTLAETFRKSARNWGLSGGPELPWAPEKE
jgi:hypothetical protein